MTKTKFDDFPAIIIERNTVDLNKDINTALDENYRYFILDDDRLILIQEVYRAIFHDISVYHGYCTDKNEFLKFVKNVWVSIKETGA